MKVSRDRHGSRPSPGLPCERSGASTERWSPGPPSRRVHAGQRTGADRPDRQALCALEVTAGVANRTFYRGQIRPMPAARRPPVSSPLGPMLRRQQMSAVHAPKPNLNPASEQIKVVTIRNIAQSDKSRASQSCRASHSFWLKFWAKCCLIGSTQRELPDVCNQSIFSRPCGCIVRCRIGNCADTCFRSLHY